MQSAKGGPRRKALAEGDIGDLLCKKEEAEKVQARDGWGQGVQRQRTNRWEGRQQVGLAVQEGLRMEQECGL